MNFHLMAPYRVCYVDLHGPAPFRLRPTSECAMRTVVPESLPPLDPAPHDAAERGGIVLTLREMGRVVRWWRTRHRRPLGDAAGMLGVTRRLLAELERGERGVRLDKALDLLAGMGFDVVLVPRDPSLSLQATGDEDDR